MNKVYCSILFNLCIIIFLNINMGFCLLCHRDQLELACDVLGKLMGAVEPTTVLAQYGQQIQRTLMHPAPRAKELVLREVRVE